MSCPLCGTRKAKRHCPALGQHICPACCGAKRLREIQCPEHCAYLIGAREHPPAIAVRQQHRDVNRLVQAMRDLNERQSRLFVLMASFIPRHRPAELLRLVDDDVVEAMGALAATFETRSRGVIYDHRPSSASAERLSAELSAVLAEAASSAPGAGFERDAAVVLRRLEAAARPDGDAEPRAGREFLETLGRVLQGTGAPAAEEPDGSPRLIVP